MFRVIAAAFQMAAIDQDFEFSPEALSWPSPSRNAGPSLSPLAGRGVEVNGFRCLSASRRYAKNTISGPFVRCDQLGGHATS